MPGRVRHARLDPLEIAAAALRVRTEGKLDLPPVAELWEWAGTATLVADAARTGPEGAVLACDLAAFPVGELAIRLWNDRGEHPLGNAMFRWLVELATLAGDERAGETHAQNMRCGP